MPVKNHSKKIIEKVLEKEEDLDIKVIPKKIHVEVAEPEIESEEKVADDPVLAEEAEDEEEMGLEDEDINPFGDKWEQ